MARDTLQNLAIEVEGIKKDIMDLLVLVILMNLQLKFTQTLLCSHQIKKF